MKQYRPSYYKDFRCIASACEDNCCIGWEIDIDENIAAFYRNVEGAFGCRLKENILCDEEGSHFILKGERCPFLNEQNLCDIYSTLGEGALCEICDQHPRYHEWFGDWKESGVGLCCEAAGRLIFSQETLSFEMVDIDEEGSEPVNEEGFAALFAARKRAFQLADENLYVLPDFGETLQPLLDEEDWLGIQSLSKTYQAVSSPAAVFTAETLRQLLDFLSDLEPIGPLWPTHLQSIAKQIPQLLGQRENLLSAYPNYKKNQKQLTQYILFRYFCKALFDGDGLSPLWLPVLACEVVDLLALEVLQRKGTFTLEDMVHCAKAFSKEMEYCTENLDALRDYCWEHFRSL